MIPKHCFLKNLRFTLSKLKKSVLLWNAVKVRNMKASGTTGITKRSLQMVPGSCSPLWPTAAWQLVAKSVMRLHTGGPHPGHATIESTLGVMSGREWDPLQMVLSKTCQCPAF